MTYDQPLTQVTMEFMARQFTHILEVETTITTVCGSRAGGCPVSTRERERKKGSKAAKSGRPIARQPTYNYRCTMGFLKAPFCFYLISLYLETLSLFLLISYLSRAWASKLCLFCFVRLGIVLSFSALLGHTSLDPI